MRKETRKKFGRVRELIIGKSVLVAFSGGVDSTVLAHVVAENTGNVVLLTVFSDTFSDYERSQASTIAEELALEHRTEKFDWLSEPDLAANTKERCYLCKRKLAKLWMDYAEEYGLSLVVEGTTACDTSGYRPGLKALKESGVISPFLEAGITKDEIREYAREKNLSVAEYPSMACLATRFPYGTTVTSELLGVVETVEKETRTIFDVRTVRARYHGDLIRIEVGRDERSKLFDADKLDRLYTLCRDLGIVYVTLDVHGYQTGSMDDIVN